MTMSDAPGEDLVRASKRWRARWRAARCPRRRRLVTEQIGGNVGRVTSAGQVTEFALSPNAVPIGITSGPDGGIWFTEFSAGQIGELLP